MRHLTITNLIKLVCTLAIFSQITHAKEVYFLLSHESDTMINEIFSYIFAISLELSILVFTLNGMVTKARFFAVISILINVIYYYYQIDVTQKFLGSMIVSFIIPITILFYSDLFNVESNIDNIAENEEEDYEDKPIIPQKRPVGRPRKIA
jgi:hypothetical protein